MLSPYELELWHFCLFEAILTCADIIPLLFSVHIKISGSDCSDSSNCGEKSSNDITGR